MDEQKALKEFQERIGYQFKDEKLLYEALSHSSFANETAMKGLNFLEIQCFL